MPESLKKKLKKLAWTCKIPYGEARKIYNVKYHEGITEARTSSTLHRIAVGECDNSWNIIEKNGFVDGHNYEIGERIVSMYQGKKRESVEGVSFFGKKEETGKLFPYDKKYTGQEYYKGGTLAKTECWKAKSNLIESCGKMKSVPPLVIDLVTLNKIRTLMEHFESNEWLAFLEEKDGIVSNMRIPKQKASSGAVQVDTSETSSIECGVIHSHHKLGAFFSGTDDDYLNNTYQFSIVVAKKNKMIEFKAVRKIKLECGSMMVKECGIEFETIPKDDNFIKEILPNIEVKTMTLFTPSEYLADKELQDLQKEFEKDALGREW